MYITKIQDFLPNYSNLTLREFRKTLDISNSQDFLRTKLEKDFLLTLVLIKFWETFPDLVFKWGTCLNKVYFPYFRLSEDLDFVLCSSWWRTSRKTLLKKYEIQFIEELEVLWLKLSYKNKANEYKIWIWEFEYTSLINNRRQTIKIDISIKKGLELEPVNQEILSIFQNLFEEDIFGAHTIACIDLQEALAEKIRAALTRTTPAIRDFFDIWYVRENSDFDFKNDGFKKLVQIKLSEVDYAYTLDSQYSQLEKQIETDLKPVLHKEYDFFLEEVYNFIVSFKK